jgi:Nuclease-related domain
MAGYFNQRLAWPARNGTTQIDHVVVSIYGLFVIETKNMDGWIFGSAHQDIKRRGRSNSSTLQKEV